MKSHKSYINNAFSLFGASVNTTESGNITHNNSTSLKLWSKVLIAVAVGGAALSFSFTKSELEISTQDLKQKSTDTTLSIKAEK